MSNFKRGFETGDSKIRDGERSEAPAGGLEKVKHAIKTAKNVKERQKANNRKRITQLVTASFACLIIAVPNVSADAAEAMSELPVIGNFFEAVTFRDYHYSSQHFKADVSIPKIVESSYDASGEQIAEEGASADINRRINETAERLIEEFKLGMKENTDGYSDLYVNYEILHTADTYFTLKLTTFQGAASGFEQNYYYTIDINTGKEISLSDLFPDGSDYITPISENIKEQMRERMSDEDGCIYWVDIAEDDPVYEWSFREIDENAKFYVNEDGEIVIAFDEGEVGPMYMGTQEFVIPGYVTKLLK